MAVISWENYVDDSAISSRSSGANSPLTGTEVLSDQNLKTRQIGDIMRWTFTASDILFINLDLGSAKTTNLIGILNHNAAGLAYDIWFGTTQENNDVGTVSGTFWTGSSVDANNDLLVLSTPFAARWIRIAITVPDPRNIDIGRVWFDDAWTYNNLMDFSIGVIDRSTKSKSRGGSTYSSSRQKLRRLDIVARGRNTADFIGTSSDFDSFLTMDLAVGESGEIVVLPLTDTEHNRNRVGVYGTISNNNPIRVLDKGANGFISEKRFSIEEDRG